MRGRCWLTTPVLSLKVPGLTSLSYIGIDCSPQNPEIVYVVSVATSSSALPVNSASITASGIWNPLMSLPLKKRFLPVLRFV